MSNARILPSPTSASFPAVPPISSLPLSQSFHAQSPTQQLSGASSGLSPSNPPVPYPFPSPSSQAASIPSSAAHSAHLADLQHQVTVKTLAFSTLQREYDSLLSRLERQRTKSLALERKSAVSDVELNSLTDERDRLASQVIALESQVDELSAKRDEGIRERATLVEQYGKIVEQATRIEEYGGAARRAWAMEKEELLARVRALEQQLGVVSGSVPTSAVEGVAGSSTGQRVGQSGVATTSSAASLSGSAPAGRSASATALDDTTALRSQLIQLRRRNAELEAALMTLKEDSRAAMELHLRIEGAVDRLLKGGNGSQGRDSRSGGDAST
ncbi:hypothetical protein BDY21DRAFT_368647 [Lineolata rhizophorae]|uniref:Uncharacterized protein n=1 Tax=Lineolata rhizophorae TaxID=578093 RepID=A0A6A6PBZ0_9PEZI|nr:hypothetical protein BDY21DRAFT_368647 [Lineolata rhizophorae]